MNPIEEIKTRLRKYPHAKYESNDSSISVFPTTDKGFTVELIVNQKVYTVSFNGWHENFQSEEEAFNCFAFGLSNECRLKEYRRGNFAYRWSVESQENGEWIEDSTTGLLLFPFWKKAEVCYLQNNLIDGKKNIGKI